MAKVLLATLLLAALLASPGPARTGGLFLSPVQPTTVEWFTANANWFSSPTRDWYVDLVWYVTGGTGDEVWYVVADHLAVGICRQPGEPGDLGYFCHDMDPPPKWVTYELWEEKTGLVMAATVYVPPYRVVAVQEFVAAQEGDGLHLGWNITENDSEGATSLELWSVDGDRVCWGIPFAVEGPCACDFAPAGAGLVGGYACVVDDWTLFGAPPYLVCFVDLYEADAGAAWYADMAITRCAHRHYLPMVSK